MKWQGQDIKLKHVPMRGCLSSTQDFSEIGTCSPRYEHQSRYFCEVSYTLYGIVVTAWLQDLGDSVFAGVGGISSGAEAEAKTLEMFRTEKKDALVNFTFFFVSPDLHHDPAFVLHVNDKLLIGLPITHIAATRVT
jgi:hypothetical protein